MTNTTPPDAPKPIGRHQREHASEADEQEGPNQLTGAHQADPDWDNDNTALEPAANVDPDDSGEALQTPADSDWGDDDEVHKRPADAARDGDQLELEPLADAAWGDSGLPLSATARTLDDELTAGDSNGSQATLASLPMGLIAVVVVALLLLAVGGYGVVQQRSALQQQVMQLQASASTAVQPGEANELRQTAQSLELNNQQLKRQLDQLILENGKLEQHISLLQSRLQPATTTPQPSALRPTVSPAPAVRAVAAGEEGAWFVNFSSYRQRRMAETWAAKLQPKVGTVAISTIETDDATIYRLRVVALRDRQQANEVAAQLASQHQLPPLWVGRTE